MSCIVYLELDLLWFVLKLGKSEGADMNIEFYGAEKNNENTVLGALYAIKAARKELDLQIVGEATPSALMSQIELYDVLLEEIRTVYACLGGARAQRGLIS